MAIGPRLDLRQSQALVMTPQLQQAIKLLQLSNAELVAFVETELERNPLLEREDPDGPAEPVERATRRYLEARFGQRPLSKDERRALLSALVAPAKSTPATPSR